MGVTLRTVHTWHAKGIVHGEKRDRTFWYSLAEVEEARRYLAARDAAQPTPVGERNARAFELYREGKGVVDVVIALRITTTMAVRLARECSPGGVYLDADAMADLAATLGGRGLSVSNRASFIDAVATLCARDAHHERSRLQDAVGAVV